jgi:hypothetical protein
MKILVTKFCIYVHFSLIYHILSSYKILQKKPYTKTNVHKRIDIKSNFIFKSPLLKYLVYIYINFFEIFFIQINFFNFIKNSTYC